MANKYTIDSIKAMLEPRGYRVLSTEYKNVNTRISIECPEHGVYITTMQCIKRGCGCPKCGNKERGLRARLSIDDIKKTAEKAGYKLLDASNYTGSKSKVKLLCDKHGSFFIQCNHLRSGHGCFKCAHEKIAEKQRLPISRLLSELGNYGYQLVSGEYVNTRSELIIKCPKHGNFKTNAELIHHGHICPQCATENRSGRNHYLWSECKDLKKRLRRIIVPWREKCMADKNYRCEITGENGTLNVHHMTSFEEILSMTLDSLGLDLRQSIADYTNDEMKAIESRFLEYNEKYSNPVVMLESLHKSFHKFCGGPKKPTSFEQLEKIKERLGA